MTDRALRLGVIIGSTREGRFADVVARWFLEQLPSTEHFDVEVIDLAVLDLPAAFPRERTPSVAAFAERIDRADVFVVITPEYNHGYPGPLKHAIDLVHGEWRGKAVGFVAYGGISGGLRAVEQLRQVFAELHVVTVRDTVSFHLAHQQFDERGRPRDPDGPSEAARVLLDQLGWWGRALRAARALERV